MASTNAAALGSNPASFGKECVVVSAKGSWVTAHANCQATAQSAAELLRPLSVGSTNVVPILIGHCTRALFRVRYGVNAVVTTSPIISAYSVFGTIAAGATSILDDGTVRTLNLFAGQTLACVQATDFRDTTYNYSVPPSMTGTDLLGGDALLVFCSTASSLAGVTPVIEVMLLN